MTVDRHLQCSTVSVPVKLPDWLTGQQPNATLKSLSLFKSLQYRAASFADAQRERERKDKRFMTGENNLRTNLRCCLGRSRLPGGGGRRHVLNPRRRETGAVVASVSVYLATSPQPCTVLYDYAGFSWPLSSSALCRCSW